MVNISIQNIIRAYNSETIISSPKRLIAKSNFSSCTSYNNKGCIRIIIVICMIPQRRQTILIYRVFPAYRKLASYHTFSTLNRYSIY